MIYDISPKKFLILSHTLISDNKTSYGGDFLDLPFNHELILLVLMFNFFF